MTAILFPRKLNQLNDVDSAGIAPGDVPTWDGASYTLGPGGGAGSFSLGVSNLGNTLGDTGVTGTRLVLAGIGNLTLSQATDLAGGTISISAGTAAAGAFSLGVSGGNTTGDTGATGSRVVLAGGNGITLSQATDANGGSITVSGITQSVQTQDRFDLTLDGNTAGALALISSGTMTLAGGNNVTLSQNGNAVTISAGGGVETQTAISGIAASNTTYTSGTVSIVGSGNITVASGTGQRVIISGSQSVQPETQTFVAGLAASNTTYTSGTISITGVGGGVTVSSNTGQRIDISVAAPVAQTGTQFSAGISGGNTSGHSGTVAGRVVFVGGNNITLSGSTNGVSETITVSAFNQTTQTQNLHNVTISGNTSGALAAISSGTMTLAGGNNITLSQAGNAITISGANVGGAQTGISGIAASNTTYTSGSVTFTGVGGGVTVSSNTGQRIDISVAAPVVQTNQAGSIYAIGNTTSSTSGTYDARTLSISGAGIISVAATNSGWKISANAQTGISSIVASDATYTSGSVQFTGSNMVTVRSSANQRVVIDASQSVQTQNMVAVTLSGNTSGAQALISSGTLTLAGGNNITVSQAGNAVTISGPNVGGAQTGISGIANSQTTYTSGSVTLSELGAITIRSTTGNHFQFSVNAQSVQPETQTFVGGIANSQTTYTSGTISMSELGAITIRSTTGNQFQFSVNSQTVQTQSLFSAGVSTGGNTAGDTGITGTRLVFVGTNNVTLSQATAAAGGTITISGPTTVAQTNQSGGAYAVGNTYSSSSGTFDARTISIRGDGIISVAATNSGWRISASQSVQAETQTFVGGLAASNTTYTSGTITITGVGGGVTVSSNTGQRIDISVAAPVAQTNQTLGMYAVQNTTGQSSSTTMDARTISVAGDGIISAGYSAGSLRISATQSVQTQNVHNVTLSGNTAGAMAHISSGTMTLAGGNNITLSQAGNAVTISGGAGGAFSAGFSTAGNTAGDTGFVTGRLALVGSNGITLSGSTNAGSQTITISGITQSVESQSIGASNLGNTLGTSGVASGGQVRAVIIGTSHITVSQSVNGASATLSLIGQPAFSGGISNLGNTGGATGVTGTRLVFVGSNNITLSQTTDANGGTVSLFGQAPAGGAFSGGVSTGGNTAGATGITGTQLVLVGTNAISLSQTTGANGGTVSIDAPATSSLVGASGISVSTNGSTISIMQTTGSAFLTSLAPYDESPMVTGAQGQATLHLSPVRIPEGVQFDRIGLAMQLSNATNSSNSITISQWVGLYTRTLSSMSLFGSTSISTNFTGSGTVGSYSLYAGPRWHTIPWTTTVPEGDYFIGIVYRTTTGGGAGHTVSQLLLSKFTNSNWSGMLGVSTAATNQRNLGQGHYTVSTSGIPNSIAFTQINGTVSDVLRSPIWMVRSGTV